MDDLIEKLEAATEGSRGLDIAIYKLVSGLQPSERDPDWIGPDDGWNHGSWKGRAPPYTTSLDSALLLVPEGMLWRVGSAEAEANVIWESKPSYYTEQGTGESWASDGDTFNAALALCIASLKARAAGSVCETEEADP